MTSFDYDPYSISCTDTLRARYFPDESRWTVQQGSILDTAFFETLGKHDIVYSWGVLYHTGANYQEIENAASKVEAGGLLYIAIFNNQGRKSKFWWHIKRFYSSLPRLLQRPSAVGQGIFFQIINIFKYTLKGKPQVAIKPLLNYRKNRGMSIFHDMIDWIGDFPYEYATLEELNEYLYKFGFAPVNVVPASSLGCPEIVYRKA